MPTFFAAVIQSRSSLTTTRNAIHFRLSLSLRGIAPKASGVLWRQSAQDVAGRPPRLSPCTARRPNITRFESLESPCRTRAPVNPGRRSRIVVSMPSEPILSNASSYDRGLYAVQSVRRKSMTRNINSSLWRADYKLPELPPRGIKKKLKYILNYQLFGLCIFLVLFGPKTLRFTGGKFKILSGFVHVQVF